MSRVYFTGCPADAVLDQRSEERYEPVDQDEREHAELEREQWRHGGEETPGGVES